MTKTNKGIACPYCFGDCNPESCPKYRAYLAVQEPGRIETEIKEMGVDPTTDSLTLMMSMQKEFAKRFHKIEGLTKEEIDHWTLAYDVCITDEVTEAQEHLVVLPEQEGIEDMYELQKEFIDIWHFLMDGMIVAGMTTQDLINKYDAKFGGSVLNSENPLKAIFINEYNYLNEQHNGTLSTSTREERDLSILKCTSKLLQGQANVRKQISWKHWKKPSDTINFDALFDAYTDVFRALVQCFVLSGLDAEQLKEIYVIKNVENVIRQKLGY